MYLEPAPTATVLSFDDDELAELNVEFEKLPAKKIVQWAVDSFSPHLCMSASFQDAVLIDIATKVDPGIEVVFIDTGYHFPETLDTVEAVRRRYGLNLRIMTVKAFDPPLYEIDPENCCSSVKERTVAVGAGSRNIYVAHSESPVTASYGPVSS